MNGIIVFAVFGLIVFAFIGLLGLARRQAQKGSKSFKFGVVSGTLAVIGFVFLTTIIDMGGHHGVGYVFVPLYAVVVAFFGFVIGWFLGGGLGEALKRNNKMKKE